MLLWMPALPWEDGISSALPPVGSRSGVAACLHGEMTCQKNVCKQLETEQAP